MTVPSQVNRSGPYLGNGVTTVFDYEFKIDDENHLKVIKRNAAGVESELTIDADYIVSDVGNPSGGQVATVVAPATGETITLLRNVPFVQETDLENQGAYYAETVEAALDLAAMRDQQLQEQVSRAVRIPASADPSALDSLIEDIIRLGDSADNIDTVANNVAAVNTVALNIADVQTVASISVDVSKVAAIDAYVVAAANNEADISTVAGISADVSTVAGIAAEVSTLAGISADVTTVAGIAGDVTTVAANVTDVKNFAAVYQAGLAADPATRADGSPLQEGDMYFNTTIGRVKIYKGSAWALISDVGDAFSVRGTEPGTTGLDVLGSDTQAEARTAIGALSSAAGAVGEANLADEAVSEVKIADEAVTFDKTGRLLQTLLDTSDNGGFERVYQNNASAPFGVKLDPKPSAPWDGGILQGFTFVGLTNEFYSAWDISGQKIIMRHNFDGSYTNASAALDSIMGHGQDINHFFDGDDLTLVVENDTRNGILFATPHTTDGGALGNVREYQLLPSGWNICWPNVSADKKHIVAAMIDGSSNIHVRVFNIAAILAGAEGDRSAEYMTTLQLLPTDEYASGSPGFSQVQAVALDGSDLYVLTGDSGYSTSKYLSRFNIITQQRLSRLQLLTGKAFANSRGGVTYELEGLEWVYRPDGTKSLWTSVVVRRSGGVGYDNLSMPLDIRGFGAVSTGRMPGAVGVSSFSSSADILMTSGENWQVQYYTGPDTTDYDLYFSIASDGTLHSPGRYRFYTPNNIDPASTTEIGANMKADLGRIVLSSTAVAAQLQTPIDSQLMQFFRGTSVVGTISVTASATSYNTTSDALLKDDLGELSFEDAKAILDLIMIHKYRWNGLSACPGELDDGAFAQELYKILPKAVTPGGWQDDEGKPAEQGDEGARYVPWAVDYSKLIPVITRCLQGTMAELQDVKSRLALNGL